MTPQRMFDIREKLEWPRDRMAQLLGCSIGLVRRWETGIVPIPPQIGEWMQGVGRWGKSLPQPPTGWRTRSARLDDDPGRTGAERTTVQRIGADMEQVRKGFSWEAIDEAIDDRVNRLRDENLDREPALTISALREEMCRLFSVLQARLDAIDKRTHENTRVMREIACHMRNAPWVPVPPDEPPARV